MDGHRRERRPLLMAWLAWFGAGVIVGALGACVALYCSAITWLCSLDG